jgi:D-sedoheptulose 7-phosphate isomerase
MINYPVKDFEGLGEPEQADRSGRHINNYLNGLKEALESVSQAQVSKVVNLLLETAANGKLIFICGNGGSASTASHMACDLSKGARVSGFPSFRAIALTDSLPQLTAWANDTSYDNCFAGQLEGLGRPGDLLIAISGSGNSPNVLRAVEMARSLDMLTLGLAGFNGGKLKSLVDDCLVIPASSIEQAEDVHLILEHIICTTLRELLKERFGLLAIAGN